MDLEDFKARAVVFRDRSVLGAAIALVIFAGVYAVGAVAALWVQADKGSHVGTVCILLLSALMAPVILATIAAIRRRVWVSGSGIAERLLVRTRQWSWDELTGAVVRIVGSPSSSREPHHVQIELTFRGAKLKLDNSMRAETGDDSLLAAVEHACEAAGKHVEHEPRLAPGGDVDRAERELAGPAELVFRRRTNELVWVVFMCAVLVAPVVVIVPRLPKVFADAEQHGYLLLLIVIATLGMLVFVAMGAIILWAGLASIPLKVCVSSQGLRLRRLVSSAEFAWGDLVEARAGRPARQGPHVKPNYRIELRFKLGAVVLVDGMFRSRQHVGLLAAVQAACRRAGAEVQDLLPRTQTFTFGRAKLWLWLAAGGLMVAAFWAKATGRELMPHSLGWVWAGALLVLAIVATVTDWQQSRTARRQTTP